ncbi:DNA-binding response regulator [Mucilaginibacter conchicola]|uniref:DNA-binding response regulator n=1 Tax=Mucilaginibacter conchicola TaxID=2303333 RepID=A0A372NPT8_9SPHI|nr:LytTR family DNA-binding domain-containing protein [Mucilaginibacter conchicola]RFZ90956.1 DNA-binding response regulator [Mucilaginibacter conchicola]
MKLNCIIIDDDVAVAAYLRDFIAQIPFLNLVATYDDPLEGLNKLEQQDVQLLLLDIGMPCLSGINLARLLHDQLGDNAPRIVFITGFERYALEGFDLDAMDYILKPVTFDRFLKMAYKAKAYFSKQTATANYQDHDFIFLRVEQELVRVYIKDILYMESRKDYVQVHLQPDDRVITALATMKSMEEKLPEKAFLRVHRSFMVSLDKITAIQHQTIRIGKALIPVSDQYRERFKTFTKQWF